MDRHDSLLEKQNDVYQKQAEEYDALVSREDYNGNLLPALKEIVDFKEMNIVEFGAETGRLTSFTAPICNSIQAFDISPHMVAYAHQKLKKRGLNNVQFTVADNRKIPLEDNCADIILAGWTIGYFSFEEDYKDKIDQCMKEMERLLKKNGTIIIIETLGTGNEEPVEYDNLRIFFEYIEEIGFRRKWVRTDYKFDSVEEAASLFKIFFGKDSAEEIRKNNSIIIPECTGIWSIKL